VVIDHALMFSHGERLANGCAAIKMFAAATNDLQLAFFGTG